MSVLREILDRMREYFSTQPAQDWWPDDSIEVIVGAVLVPGSTWKTVAKILEEFKRRDLLDLDKILELSQDDLCAIIRPAGFQPKKSRCLREVLMFIRDTAGGNFSVFFSRDPEILRKELLSIFGVGEATADNILLYAGNLAIYSIDPFTRRLMFRHGIVPPKTKDVEMRKVIHEQLADDDPDLLHDFQALLVRLGRKFCGKSVPLCSDCPLNSFLPEGGAIGESPLQMRKLPKRDSVETQGTPEKLQIEIVEQPPVQIDLSNLNELESEVFALVSVEPTPIDSVIEKCDVPTPRVLATLNGLEMRHFIARGEGNTVRRII